MPLSDCIGRKSGFVSGHSTSAFIAAYINDRTVEKGKTETVAYEYTVRVSNGNLSAFSPTYQSEVFQPDKHRAISSLVPQIE